MKSVMIIDDEAAIRRALTRVLESAGYSVRVAANGADGIDALKEEAADYVITDIIMPNMHGVDTIRAIARDFPHIGIIAISGGGNFKPAEYQPHAFVTEAYLAAARKAGAHAALTKPFKTEDIVRALTALGTGPEESATLN